MSERKQRPRIDSILNAIKEGTYDDRLTDIQEAVGERLSSKREEILARVREIYGPEAQIVTQSLPNPNDFRPQEGEVPVPQSMPGHQWPTAGGAAAPPTGPIPSVGIPDSDPDGPDFESRSPLIMGGPPQ